MVKPPKTMQPEAIDLEKAGRAAGKAFQDDSFHNYMARKIDLQRQQFGLVLPPNPTDHKPEVRFAPDVEDNAKKRKRKLRCSSSGFAVKSVLRRLKRRHGSSDESFESLKRPPPTAEKKIDCEPECGDKAETSSHPHQSTLPSSSSPSDSKRSPSARLSRPDLFLMGVVVLVNGYTNPDTETLQRLLHRHGGDLEKYETSRVTHIIAEHLSTAKAKIYKQQRQPIPVCHPKWIVDCVAAGKLLAHGPYLIEEVRDEDKGMQSVASFFMTTADKNEKQSSSLGDSSSARNSKRGETSIVDATRQSSSEPIDQVCQQKNQPDSSPSSVVQHSQDSDVIFVGLAPASDMQPPQHNGDEPPSEADPEIMLNPAADNTERDSKPAAVLDPISKKGTSVAAVRGHSSAAVSPSTVRHASGRTDEKYINGRVRTVGTDPNFLDSFFNSSRLSFIGSYKQRVRQSPTKKARRKNAGAKRFVFHVDMDCFFASVVLRNFPEYRDKPVAISHHGKRSSNLPSTEGAATKGSTSECATCNYEARKYGIKKGMFLGRAKELCPDLVVLHYDFEGYESVSEQVADILYRCAGEYDGSVEQVSCDEAYMEVFVEADDTESSDRIVERLAASLRQEIFDETQCTASIGVASNKLIAKLGTDRVKPNGSIVVRDYKQILKELRLRDLHGVGYRMERKLAEHGLESVQDVWELGDRGESELVRVLGPGLGRKLFENCNGRDDRPVAPAERQSIGAECNYGVRFNGPYGVEHMIDGLAREVEKRMLQVGVKGVKVTLKVKQRKEGAPPPPKFLGHGSCHNLSKSSDTPGNTPTDAAHLIGSICKKLFADMNVPAEDVRGMGILVTKLDSKEPSTDPNHGIQRWLGSGKAATAPAQTDGGATNAIDARVRPKSDLPGDGVPVDMEEQPLYSQDVDNAPQIAKEDGGDDDFDIDLPSLSQLHMSQVEQLPSPLRRKALSKIELEKGEQARVRPHEVGVPQSYDSRFLQTDIGRMLRLAAVKSGAASLPGETAEALSIADFENLSLEMQLQVANGDMCGVGTVCRKRAAPRDRERAPKPTKSTSTRSSSPATAPSTAAAALIKDQSPAPANQALAHFHYEDEHDFFSENIFPLNLFLDENPTAVGEAVDQVCCFFRLCIEEGRLRDLTLLLRSIKNRRDAWSGNALQFLALQVNEEVKKREGTELDMDWLLSRMPDVN